MSEQDKNCKVDCFCHSETLRGFYLDSSMQVFPCCHYASIYGERNIADEVPVRDKNYEQSLVDNPNWNSLNHHTLEDIAKHKQYQENIYYPGWISNPSDVCLHFCNKYK
jgi:hypothetical protein